jgi:hypothetical protein
MNETLLNSLLLSAEIEMQGMVAENKYNEQNNLSIKYRKHDFDNLITKYSILNLAKYQGTTKEKVIQFINTLTSQLKTKTC